MLAIEMCYEMKFGGIWTSVSLRSTDTSSFHKMAANVISRLVQRWATFYEAIVRMNVTYVQA